MKNAIAGQGVGCDILCIKFSIHYIAQIFSLSWSKNIKIFNKFKICKMVCEWIPCFLKYRLRSIKTLNLLNGMLLIQEKHCWLLLVFVYGSISLKNHPAKVWNIQNFCQKFVMVIPLSITPKSSLIDVCLIVEYDATRSESLSCSETPQIQCPIHDFLCVENWQWGRPPPNVNFLNRFFWSPKLIW